jgi:hypothetical protein
MSAEQMAEPPSLRKVSGEDLVARLARLEELLTACPTDILSRCELAAIHERLGHHQEALFNWKAVLACDANNLKAREGMARCRRLTGRPLQSTL